VVQPSSGYLFAQSRPVLFYAITGHELAFRSAIGFDLISNIVVKSQYAFVLQVADPHGLSPYLRKPTAAKHRGSVAG
jgi:hypothetical protein